MKPFFREIFLGKRELILQGDLVHPDGVRQGMISFSKGKGFIHHVGDIGETEDAGDLEPDAVIENGLIFPGFIDLHVHAREDQSREWVHKENYISAGKAALAGGVTGFADMPNTPVPVIDEATHVKKFRLSRYSGMDVLIYAGIGPGTRPLESNVPYKVFMGKSVGELFFRDRGQLKDTLKAYEGKHVSFHCEDPEILEEHHNRERHAERRPPEAEVSAVEFALELIEEFGLKGNLCHISTRESLELIERTRKRSGLPITVEATPHHLLLEDSVEGIRFPDILKNEDKENPEFPEIREVFFQVNPPIREERDRRAVFSAFKEGKIDYLATDHAPHIIKEKENGMSGLPHLDTFGNIVGCLMAMEISPEVVARAACYNPGNYFSEFGFNPRKLTVGENAHLTILVKEEEMVKREGVFSKSGWSPFEGRIFPWRVAFTVLQGRVWAKTCEPGEGRS